MHLITIFSILMRNNLSNALIFDKNRHFAFLRDYEDHTILFACNFSNREAHIRLTIPEHAFEWMEIPVSENLYPGKIIDVDIAPYDAVKIVLI